MNFKKSVFGGYKKSSVDAAVKELIENEEQAQAKIALLDNEFRLSKEATQKNMESIQTDLAIKQKSLLDLTRTLDEKNNRIAELEIRLQTVKTEIETQYKTLFSDMEDKQRIRTRELDEEYHLKARQLEEEYLLKTRLLEEKRQDARIPDYPVRDEIQNQNQKEDQIRKIGQLYVNAQENTEKIKKESKYKILESVDNIFGELSKTQEQLAVSIGQIDQKKINMKHLVKEIAENIQYLQTKMESLEQDQVDFTAPLGNLKTMKDRIVSQVQREFDESQTMVETIPDITPKLKEAYYQPPVVSAPVRVPETQPASFQADLIAQIEELKNKMANQQQLLDLRTMQEKSKKEARMESLAFSVPEISTSIPVPAPTPAIAPAIAPATPYSTATSYDTQDVSTAASNPVLEEPTQDTVQMDQERAERESYAKYFAEIGKKYSKDPQPSRDNDYSTPPVSQEQNSNFQEPALSVNSNMIPTVNVDAETTANANIPDATGTPIDQPGTKKPSIKDILNKYANMK